MWTGVAFALAAGLMWGLVFVGPLMLPEYPTALQSFGRYLAFGLIALPLGWLDRKELARLTRTDWLEALKLAAVGNVVYYLFLASAIQRAGGPLPTMIIGTLPVVIAISANLFNHHRDGRLPWGKMLPSLGLIALGIALVNQVELSHLLQDPQADLTRYAVGALLAVGAVGCWTWYPIRNGNWLREHPGRNPRAWATAQGLMTLPLAVLGYAGFWVWMAWSGTAEGTAQAAITGSGLGGGATAGPQPLAFSMPFGPRPEFFVSLMVAIGLLSSWLGTLCWNEASQRLPTALVGQLIVFETLAALSYAYVLRQQWPEVLTLAGVGLLVAGVIWATRVRPTPLAQPTEVVCPPH